MEMAGEFLDDPDVGFYGTLSIITSLEFLQHHSAKMGHKDTSCDHNLSPCQANIARFTSREASAAPAAWFKRACGYRRQTPRMAGYPDCYHRALFIWASELTAIWWRPDHPQCEKLLAQHVE